MNKLAPYFVFTAIMLIAGLSAGYATAPGEWYAQLNKPPFNPPNWIFAPVWTALYILIGIAGGLVWNWSSRSLAMKFWYAQLVLNVAWSFFFFFFRLPSIALIDISALLLVIVLFIRVTRSEVPFAAWLFVPYLCWVAFATILNASIVILN